MRVFKFRAYSKEGKSWLMNLPVCIKINEDGLLNCFADDEVNQFTGLHDKNGREIYEGDIIRQAIIPPF